MLAPGTPLNEMTGHKSRKATMIENFIFLVSVYYIGYIYRALGKLNILEMRW